MTKTVAKDIFGKKARVQLLINLINNSIQERLYPITYEVTKRFMSDFLKAQRLPIFDSLFQDLIEDTSRYEAKMALMMNLFPLMNKHQATRFMKIIEQILNEPAKNSIFRNNINPLRVGLMLYKILDEVQKEYSYSEHSTNLMKEKVTEQLQ